MRSPLPPSWSPQLLSVLRIVVGFLFMLHGMQKLFGIPSGFPAPIEPWSQLWIAGVLETFGGALILVGLLTHPVAFILSGEMAVAYFQVHAPAGFWPMMNRGEVVVLFCFVFLYFAVAGPGPWSLDALFSRRRDPERKIVSWRDHAEAH